MKTVKYNEYQIAVAEIDARIEDFRRNGSGCWSSLTPFVNKNSGLFNDKPIEMQLNWCANGNVDLDKAEQFASELQEAIELARNFKYNGYVIEY